jgi:hypothetical protein
MLNPTQNSGYPMKDAVRCIMLGLVSILLAVGLIGIIYYWILLIQEYSTCVVVDCCAVFIGHNVSANVSLVHQCSALNATSVCFSSSMVLQQHMTKCPELTVILVISSGLLLACLIGVSYGKWKYSNP